MKPQLILGIFKLSSYKHKPVYQGVHLAKKSFTQATQVRMSLDQSIFKALHQEVKKNIVNVL